MTEFLIIFDVNTATILVWLTSFIMVSLAMVIFTGSKERSARVFAFASVVAAIWTFLMGLDISIPGNIELTKNISGFLDDLPRLTYFMGSITAMLFFYFCLLFTSDKEHRWGLWVIPTFAGLTLPLYFFTDLIIVGHTHWLKVEPFTGAQIWSWQTGSLDLLYIALFNGLFAGGVYLIYRKMRKTQPSVEKTRLRVMFWVIILGFVPPSIVAIILPAIGVYDYGWLGTVSSLIWMFGVSYSIMKHHQMNVRVVFIEILVLAALFLLFINIFI